MTTRLSTKAIKEFIKAYALDKGIVLTEDEANQKGLELLNFVALICKPQNLDKHTVICNNNFASN